MNLKKGLLALAAGSLLASAAAADIHPNTAPGFAPGQSFSVGAIDNVNLFNGALTLNIPIGMSYPVNGGFSYSLKLIYNSSPWIFDTIIYQEPHDVTRLRARPTTCSNAGLGWRVSLGRFNPDCQTPDSDGSPLPAHTYQDESGADHVFYNTLHQGDDEDTLPGGVQDILYTRDGTYLRLIYYSTGVRDLEYPDGTIRTFNPNGRLTDIKDRFGNKLHVDYGTDSFGNVIWTLTDNTRNAAGTLATRTQKDLLSLRPAWPEPSRR